MSVSASKSLAKDWKGTVSLECCTQGADEDIRIGSSSSSAEDSSGVMDGVRRGFGCWRGDWEKRRVCLTVGEVRNGRVRGFYGVQ